MKEEDQVNFARDNFSRLWSIYADFYFSLEYVWYRSGFILLYDFLRILDRLDFLILFVEINIKKMIDLLKNLPRDHKTAFILILWGYFNLKLEYPDYGYMDLESIEKYNSRLIRLSEDIVNHDGILISLHLNELILKTLL